ncbi:MAG TPA: GNAT family N-acetyltransferase, partial [Dongiaceae bacterium]|nr:GNAT family N-acetyltransferase [Dongiaceae bacterium]
GLGEYEFEAMHPEDIKRRRKNMLRRRLPHLVAERDETVVGYAYAVPFRKRPAYRYAVKHSIYVHKDHLHSGIGRRLLPALIDACAEAGYRQMIAYIDVANLPSIQLHEAPSLPAGRDSGGGRLQIRPLDGQPDDAARVGAGQLTAAGNLGPARSWAPPSATHP